MARSGGDELLSEAARTFAEASADPALVLDKVVELVGSALDCFCVVSLPSADGAHLEPVAHFDRDTTMGAIRRALAAATPVPIDSDLSAAQVFRSGQALMLPPPNEAFLQSRFPEPEQFERARALQTGAILITPRRVRATSLGIFTLVRPGANEFSEAERRLATLLAQHSALAIHNSQLVEALQRALQVREHTQFALAESEARLRQIFETANEDRLLSSVLHAMGS